VRGGNRVRLMRRIRSNTAGGDEYDANKKRATHLSILK
jgi:hypothetical protein